MLLLLLVNALILLALGGLHVYWANGGKKYLANALPESIETGKPLFVPTPLMTVAVAIVLLAMGIMGLYCVFFVRIQDMGNINWYTLALGIAFGLRAIGDFKYVGFAKKVTETAFARMDTRYYTPLCTYIALSNLWISF
jgi:hypothetical protein